MVLPAVAAIQGGSQVAGKGMETAGNVAGAVADYQIAKVDAKARQNIAQTNANSNVTMQQIDESSEVMSILDRPFARYRSQKGGELIEYNLSLQTIAGLLSIAKAVQHEMIMQKNVAAVAPDSLPFHYSESHLHDMMVNFLDMFTMPVEAFDTYTGEYMSSAPATRKQNSATFADKATGLWDITMQHIFGGD